MREALVDVVRSGTLRSSPLLAPVHPGLAALEIRGVLHPHPHGLRHGQEQGAEQERERRGDETNSSVVHSNAYQKRKINAAAKTSPTAAVMYMVPVRAPCSRR